MRGTLPPKTRMPLAEDKKATEYLANERTFLAWIRTSIAVISLGFVVAKFGVWMRELAARIDPQKPVHSSGMSLPMGVAMMALGGLLSVLAALHYHIVNQSIERGEVRANRGLIVIVTVAVALLAALMIIYMLLTEENL
jgi:putative membrane protein